MPLRAGTQVDHYEIGPLLGAGAMGEVYRARDLTLHREVALKVIAPQTTQGSIMVGSIDGAPARPVMASRSQAVYALPGYLLYRRDGDVAAHRFDISTLSVVGDPIVLAANAWAWTTAGLTAMSASDTGLLLFATLGPVGDAGEWIDLSISPDEHTLAAERMDAATGNGTIWTIDLARNVPARLTPEPTWSLTPIWSVDGTRIVYGASREGASDLFVRPAGAGAAEVRFYASPALKVPTDWTRDGRIVFTETTGGSSDVVMRPAAGGERPARLAATTANEGYGKVSPNSRWLAYASNESGRLEVYVRALQGNGRWPISRNGGGQPRWRRDGKELYFVAADSTLMAVSVMATGAPLTAGPPEPLPIRVQPDVTGWRYVYDAASLGQRFIANVPVAGDVAPPIMAIPHWTALLRK